MSFTPLHHRPFEGLSTMCSSRAGGGHTVASTRAAGVPSGAGNGVTTGETPAPSAVITEDLPAAWIERMLFNPDTPVEAWSEMDALRQAQWRNPPPSPHPLRPRRANRRRLLPENGCGRQR